MKIYINGKFTSKCSSLYITQGIHWFYLHNDECLHLSELVKPDVSISFTRKYPALVRILHAQFTIICVFALTLFKLVWTQRNYYIN